MLPPRGPDPTRQTRLDEAVAVYLRRLDNGEAVDRSLFLADHPDLVDELLEFFETSDDFERLAESASLLRTPAQTHSLYPSSPHIPSSGLLEGDTLGEYVLQREVGRGGMGIVFAARQPRLERTVALKMLQVVRLLSEADVQRFRIEAAAAAALDHPHIVPIYEVGEARLGGDGPLIPYFSMKLLSGGTLAHFKRNSRDLKRVILLVSQVARAVQHAHERGVLHRDLKPSNVLLDTEGTPYVADFGLAKRTMTLDGGAGVEPLTRTGEILGTPGYMAPEQAEARLAPTIATDIYGLGAILYDLLTDRPPFKGDSALETLVLMKDRDPEPPSRHNPAVPADIDTICLKCLEKEPQRRYVNAAALADDLERWVRGEPITARPTGWGERFLKWTRRHPGIALLALLCAILALSGLVGVFSQWWRAEVAHEQVREALAIEKGLRQNVADALENERDLRQQKEQALSLANARQYDYQVALAEREWRAGRILRAEELLAACPAEQRCWDWHYVKRLCNSERFSYRGHLAGVTAAAFSPDGTQIASTSLDATVQLFDATTGARKQLLASVIPKLTPDLMHGGLAFHPEGRRLAAAYGGVVRLWDLESGHQVPLPPVPPKHRYFALRFTPDGRSLLGDFSVARREGPLTETCIWDILQGKPLIRLPVAVGQCSTCALSPDGRFLAVGGAGHTVRVFTLPEGKEVLTLGMPGEAIWGLAYQPDGTHIATSDAKDTIRIWDARVDSPTGVQRTQPVRVLRGHSGRIQSLAFSPNGHFLAAGGYDQIVRIWNLTTEAVEHQFRGHRDTVATVAFSPDGQRVASGSDDRTVKVWEVGSAQEWRPGGGKGQLHRGVVLSPDQRVLATNSGTSIQILQVATGEVVGRIRVPGNYLRAVVFSADGTRLYSIASGNFEITTWDWAQNRLLHTLRGHRGTVQCVACSPDGKTLASGAEDRAIRLWDASTGQVIRLLGEHNSSVAHLAFSPDNRHLAVSGAAREITLWDWQSGQISQTLAGPNEPLTSLRFSPDGRVLASASGHNDPTVRLWDTTTGRMLHVLRGHVEGIYRLSFTPNGQRLASGDTGGVVKVWDINTGQEVLTLPGERATITELEFTPDGARLLGFFHLGRGHRIWDGTPMPGP